MRVVDERELADLKRHTSLTDARLARLYEIMLRLAPPEDER